MLPVQTGPFYTLDKGLVSALNIPHGKLTRNEMTGLRKIR